MSVKFNFDYDFEAPPKPIIDENGPKYTEEQLTAVREQAFHQGMEEGIALQRQVVEVELTQALCLFEDRLISFVDAEERKRKDIYVEAAQLAKTIALKISLTEDEKNSVDRVVACMEKVNQSLLDKPTMSISVNPKISQILADRIKNSIANGSIQIIPDEQLNVNDCRFSWAAGGAEVVLKNILDEIDRVIDQISTQKETEHE